MESHFLPTLKEIRYSLGIGYWNYHHSSIISDEAKIKSILFTGHIWVKLITAKNVGALSKNVSILI